MNVLVRLAGIAATLLPGCFAPAFEDGQFSCPTGECPAGFDCVEGLCVRSADTPRFDAATPPIDAAVSIDGAPPIDAAPADAAAPREPTLYRYDLDSGAWTSEPAAALFSGPRAPEPAAIQTAWSHCRPGNTVCFGTADAWHCTAMPAADRWFTNTWSYLAEPLVASPPTYTTAWDNFSGFQDRVELNRDAAWWHFRFFGAPRDDGGGVGHWNLALTDWYGADGSADHDVEWSEQPNAPPSAAAIVADYGIDTTWYVWTADGTEYRRGAAGWLTPGAPAALAAAGAPPIELVTAAAHCDGVLYVVARGE